MFESACGPGEVTVAGVQHADPFALAAALAPLTEDAVMALSADEAECVVAATQRVVNAMAARQAVAVDRYTQHVAEQTAAEPGRGGDRQVLTDTAAMLAPILRIAPRTMTSRIEAARWGGCLPRTFALAWAGDLETYRVAAITKAAMTLGFDDLVEFEARLFDREITDLAAARVKDRAVKIAHRLAARHPDPDPVLPRWVRTQGDEHPGCTRWSALLPTDRSARMWAAIDTLAAEYLRANPALSVAEARADAFTDLLLGNAHVTTDVTIVLPADLAPYTEGNPLDEPSRAERDGTQPDDHSQSNTSAGDSDPEQADPEQADREPAVADEVAGDHDEAGHGDRVHPEDHKRTPAAQAADGNHETPGDPRHSDSRGGDDRDGDQGPGDDAYAGELDGTSPRASAQHPSQDGAAARAAGPDDANSWPPARPEAGSPPNEQGRVSDGPSAESPDQADATGSDEREANPPSDVAVGVPSNDNPPSPWPWGASRPPGADPSESGEPDGGRPLCAAPSAQERAAEIREMIARIKALPAPTPPRPPARDRLPRTAREAWLDIAWFDEWRPDDSEAEVAISGRLSHCTRVDLNPFLDRDPAGEHVWFVPGPVLAPGLGALIPAQLTAILADPDIRLRLARAHPDTGAVSHLDQQTYRPGAALARLVRARDGTCRFPGCATPAERCHLDHVIRYPDGPTSAANLQSLCSGHHGFKHHARWTVTMTETGICTWTAPNGRTHTTYPHAVYDQAA